MQCNCTECDLDYAEEYRKWKTSADEYVKKHNIKGTIDEAVVYLHMPINLLRLPCDKGSL